MSADGTGAPPFAGTVARRAGGRWQGYVLLRLEAPARGLASVGAWGEQQPTASVQLCLYGADGEAVAAREQPAWEAWMRGALPGPGRRLTGAGRDPAHAPSSASTAVDSCARARPSASAPWSVRSDGSAP